MGGALEVGRGEVVAAEAEIEVGEVRETPVEVGFDGVLLRAEHVEGAVALGERGWRDAGGERHVGKPLEDRPALGDGPEEAVRQQHEDGVLEMARAPCRTERREQLVEAEPGEVGPDRGDPAERRRPGGLEGRGGDPGPLGVGGQRGDDPVELAGLPQLAHLAEAQQRVVGVLPPDPHRFDEGEVRVGLVAPSAYRRLHEHVLRLGDTSVNVEYLSPLRRASERPNSDKDSLVKTL